MKGRFLDIAAFVLSFIAFGFSIYTYNRHHIALALSPFARKTAELVNSGAYEAAAGSCYVLFRCLAKTCKEHEDWFLRPDGGKRHPYGDAERSGFTGYGDTYTKLAIFTDVYSGTILSPTPKARPLQAHGR